MSLSCLLLNHVKSLSVCSKLLLNDVSNSIDDLGDEPASLGSKRVKADHGYNLETHYSLQIHPKMMALSH